MPRFKTNKYDQTENHIVLGEHQTQPDGSIKTVCVSACLDHLGLPIESYDATSTPHNRLHFMKVLEDNGYVMEAEPDYHFYTLTEVRRRLRNDSSLTKDDRLLIVVEKRGAAHSIVLDGCGNIVIDTAQGRRWKYVRYAWKVIK